MRNKKSFIFIICIVLIMLFGCKNSKGILEKESKNLPQIIVGSDNYPPYNYEDANGNPTGIDVDLATEAFKRIGYRAVFKSIDWEKKKELVENGEIDCIWGSFSINGREKQYQWTKPYMYSRQVVAVRNDSDIYKLSDLKDKRVAVQSTTKPESIFLSHSNSSIPQIGEVFSLQNRELIYPYLSKGYVDAIAAHETAILQCMSDYDLDYRILDESLLTVGLGVAFSINDDKGLADELSEIFDKMKEDGSMKEIIGKYLDNPEKFMEADINEK